jgi:hypothetical protein
MQRQNIAEELHHPGACELLGRQRFYASDTADRTASREWSRPASTGTGPRS